MPGKYSKLKGTLTSFSQEQTYQEKVNACKVLIREQLQDSGQTLSPKSFGTVLIQAKLEKTRLESLVSDQNLIIMAMNQELVDLLESQEITSLKMESGVSLGIKDDVYCSVSDKEAFHKWIRETKQEDLFTVHYQTMASLTKLALNEGKDTPPGITPYFKQSISVRGVKGLEQTEG